MLIFQNAARPFPVFLDESSATVTAVYLTKSGGSRVDVLGDISAPVVNGRGVWIALINSHVNTLGAALVEVETATELVPKELNVVAYDPYEALATEERINQLQDHGDEFWSDDSSLVGSGSEPSCCEQTLAIVQQLQLGQGITLEVTSPPNIELTVEN